MKRILKVGSIAAFLAFCLAVAPASAQSVMKGSTCSKSIGGNRITYDCNFNVRNYEMGTPVTFDVNYTCSGDCSQVLSFGMQSPPFTPKGAKGQMVGGKRLENGLSVTFVFTSAKGNAANAHFSMNVGLYDENGVMQVVPAKFKANLKK